MFLSDLREPMALFGSAAGSNVIRTALDADLLTSCSALKDADEAFHAGIRRIEADPSREQDATSRELAKLGRERVAIAAHIANTPALSDGGLLGKLSVIERLLPQHYEDPAPARDAVTLSFVSDMERMHPAPASGEGGAVLDPLDSTSTIIEAAQECLRLMRQVAEGMTWLEESGLSPERQQELYDRLLRLLREKRAAVTALAGMSAMSFDAVHAKGSVLRSLLESGWLEDGHRVRADLAHSYIADVRKILAEADTGRSATVEPGSWWSSVAGRFRSREAKA